MTFDRFVSVNPARAGMIPPGQPHDRGVGRKPRASGDDPRGRVIHTESGA